MQTPDITLVQKLVAAVLGVVSAVLPTLIAFGVHLSDVQVTSLLGLAAALGSVFVLADAHIRNGRAGLASTRASLDLQAQMFNAQFGPAVAGQDAAQKIPVSEESGV